MLRIGLSACFFHADPQRPIFKGKTLLYMEESLAQWVMREGVHVALIPRPVEGGPSLAELASDYDGLVLQGGSDVAPQSYGEAPLKPEWSGDAPRDAYEIALLKEFRAQGKPVLGICRGAQLANVAFGGSLVQDIPSQVPAARKHRDWEIYDQNFHALHLEPGSELGRLYEGKGLVKVNSIHHQAIKDLGLGLAVEAKSEPDGLVEAVRALEGPWMMALQWHPEFQDPKDPSLLDGRVLLRAFLAEAKAAKEKRRV